MNPGIRNSFPYRYLSDLKGLIEWQRRMFAPPSPPLIKNSCLLRNGIANAVWIETGTYLGSTTCFLARRASMVYSIEPALTLFANAREYFAQFKNVEIINGTSEEVLPRLLPAISGDVSFWLDGYYSHGITFKGSNTTPIAEEPQCIGEHLSHFQSVVVLVDDIRCFNPHIGEYSAYPSIDFLVDWARKNNLRWHIEHDIFIAKNH